MIRKKPETEIRMMKMETTYIYKETEEKDRSKRGRQSKILREKELQSNRRRH
ncbi:LOW QUALITY PROTEIN: uncharacterized protein LOC110230979 [Arabidopsis lyrata subsp. lyrata]|uniref:LOW QUALITY PROTEIN: uncharacterized protein LOC110230979 n=1 Tax=Arabidopsis lyrata subsp. lyrata TaxID=81972 RepID=UPI000A29A9A5|nr:LOW QUALITY PROTEIN: uncharacterized protein LOC110230979 [Arabidopsis lyrata subsp. lyrata]|eukprot:XP_020891050.1 LOW QUALITY PROTEIN: uncharacterized protein LOC110230979 [Arabidopsis lyrata subsp. lyrata]